MQIVAIKENPSTSNTSILVQQSIQPAEWYGRGIRQSCIQVFDIVECPCLSIRVEEPVVEVSVRNTVIRGGPRSDARPIVLRQKVHSPGRSVVSYLYDVRGRMNVRGVPSGVDGRERAVDEVDEVLGGNGTPAVLISAITDNGGVNDVVVEGRRIERLVRCVVALEVLVELQGLSLLSTHYSSYFIVGKRGFVEVAME